MNDINDFFARRTNNGPGLILGGSLGGIAIGGNMPSTPWLREKRELPEIVKAILAKPLAEFSKQRERPVSGEAVTHAALLLDASSSMLPHRERALVGHNEQVRAVQEGAIGAGKTLVSLNIFSTISSPRFIAAPVERLKPLDYTDYLPSGSTALFDALGDTIAALLQQPEADAPNTAFLVSAFTDGEENASSTYSGQVLKELITRLEATGRWTFALMGPRGGAEELASVLNLNARNVASFDPLNQASVTNAFAGMACANTAYMSTRAVGSTSVQNFYDAAADLVGSQEDYLG